MTGEIPNQIVPMNVIIIISSNILCVVTVIQFLGDISEDSITEDSITEFAQQYKLRNTLQYLSGGVSVGDLAVQSPKVYHIL